MPDETNDRQPCCMTFRMKKVDFMREMFRFWGLAPLAAPLLLSVAGIITGCLVDISYFMIPAMAVFIIVPMLLAFLYYYHGLSRNCYFNVVDHNLGLGENGVEISMFFSTPDGDGGADADTEGRKCIRFNIEYCQIQKYKVSGDSVIFPVGKPMNGFIWLPVSAFEDMETFGQVVGNLASRI